MILTSLHSLSLLSLLCSIRCRKLSISSFFLLSLCFASCRIFCASRETFLKHFRSAHFPSDQEVHSLFRTSPLVTWSRKKSLVSLLLLQERRMVELLQWTRCWQHPCPQLDPCASVIPRLALYSSSPCLFRPPVSSSPEASTQAPSAESSTVLNATFSFITCNQ